MFQKVSKILAVTFLALISSSVFAAQLVNINKADAATIAENLNGIGDAKAKAIVAYRVLHGDFRSQDDLIKVKGIGSKLVERNRDLISFVKGSSSSDGVPKLTESQAVGKTEIAPTATKDESASVLKAAGS